MSKRKHFHSIGSGKKMFQYAALDGAGLPRRFLPKKKESSHCDRQKAAETGEKRSGYQPPTDSNYTEKG